MSEENIFSEEELDEMFCDYEHYFRENINRKFEDIRNFLDINGERFRTPNGTLVTKYKHIYCVIDYPFILMRKERGGFNFLSLDYECVDICPSDSRDIIDFIEFFSRGEYEKLIPEENPLKISI
jgi:hypothetical protein